MLPKPSKESGFDRPVAWLFGRELLATLKLVVVYSLFRGKLDPRDWMQPNVVDLRGLERGGEFWFDYIADTGDGQKATYSIAYLCMADLWVPQTPKINSTIQFGEDSEHSRRLPCGEFLFIGGDTGYHVADYPTLAYRFQAPFHWAFQDLKRDGRIRDGRRPLFGIPGNHDYYDAIDGFNRQLRRPTTGEDDPGDRPPLLSIPGFKRSQEASYVALQLPFDWWFLGMDAQGGDMDFRQVEFFRKLNEENKPVKLVVATPEPTTVLGKYSSPDSKIAETFEAIGLERPFLRDAKQLPKNKCRLDLSGDTHHYARYWGPGAAAPSASNYASLVSGLGGAFVQPSHVDVGQIEEQALYPSKEASRKAFARELFNPWNILSGGYVWLIGFIFALVVSFAATVTPTSKEAVHDLLSWKALGLTPQQLEPVRPSSKLVEGSDMVGETGRGSLGRLPGFLLAISFLAIIGAVAYARRLLNQLAKRKGIGGVKGRAISLRQRVAVGGMALVGAASVIGWMWGFAVHRAGLRDFSESLLVLAGFVWAAIALTGSLFYNEYLFKQAYEQTIRWFDYWPGWVLNLLAAGSAGAAVWLFGKHPAAYLISDLLFALVLLALAPGTILLAVIVGGSLHGALGRFGFAGLGVWHGLLQLSVPFVLVYFGSWWMLAVAVAFLFVFRKLGQLLASRNARALLVLAWIVYGASLIWLPLYGDRLIALPVHLSGPLLPLHDLKWRLAACVTAGLIGMLMTCVWLGWYFAVSVAFNGHMDQAGGAGRIERFKQFIRVRVTEQSLTAYVIAVDDPKTDGRYLKPVIVDVFELRVGAGEPA